MPQIKAVIFDMDGVLIDTRELIYRAMEDVLVAHGVQITRKEISSVTGKPVQGMYALLAPHLDPAALEEAHLAHHEEHIHLIKSYDGVATVLGLLKQQDYKLGVFTGFGTLTYERLDRYKLRPYFDEIVESTMYTAHKPDPEGLLLCMDMLGITDPKEVAYIGDSPNDVQAGQTAKVGMSIGITSGFATEEELAASKPDALVHSLTELLQLLESPENGD